MIAHKSSEADKLPDDLHWRFGEMVSNFSRVSGNRVFDRVAELCDTFGPRPAGSDALAAALNWTVAEMHSEGLSVRKVPATLPSWIRGEEAASLLLPNRVQPLTILGLPGSVPTNGTLEADVLYLRSFGELNASRDRGEVVGKIVVFDHPFVNDYMTAARYRWASAGPVAAAGGVAVLSRSVTRRSLNTPHTGAMDYDDDDGGIQRIPAAALTIEDSTLIGRLSQRGIPLRVRLRLSSTEGPAVSSYNIVAEVPGAEQLRRGTNETQDQNIVLLAAHLDSWDQGSGAVDDAAGCIVMWEALRLIHAFPIRPRNTVRLVLFVGEERGQAGAHAYAERVARGEEGQISLAIESDDGTLSLDGWNINTIPQPPSPHLVSHMTRILELLAPLSHNASRLDISEDTGADTYMLGQHGAVLMMPRGEGDHDGVIDYFDMHHAPSDTPDKLVPAALGQFTAGIATLAYAAADMRDWQF